LLCGRPAGTDGPVAQAAAFLARSHAIEPVRSTAAESPTAWRAAAVNH